MADTQPPTLPDDELVSFKVANYRKYRQIFESDYWPNFRKNEELYAAFDPTAPDKFSTNTGTGIVESGVNRTMVATRKVTADIQGPVATINRAIEEALQNLGDSIFEDRDVAKLKGSYRDAKEVMVRDLKVVGNAVGKANYVYATTEDSEGRPRVVADGTYLTPLHYTQYVFNPARPYCWNNSPEKFVSEQTSYDSLREQAYEEFEVEEPVIDPLTNQPMLDPATGEPVTEKRKKSRGLWNNLDKLAECAAKNGKIRPLTSTTSDPTTYTGDGDTASVWVEDVELLYCWEGAHLIVIAENSVVIRDEYDPFGTGSDNLVTAMLIKQNGRPVAWGVLDHIRGLIQMKDDSLNDRKALVDRTLKIGGVYNSTDVNELRRVAEVILKGGVASGDPAKWKEINVINPSVAQALLSPQELQGEIERTGNVSNYANGLTSQETDQTQGTASGIRTLVQAAEPNFETFLVKVQEQIDTPFLDWSMQVLANLAGDDDIRWVTRTKGSREVIGITKRFLQGRPMLDDLIKAGILTPEDAQQYVAEDPQLATEPYVDANWTIKVTLDPQSASDRYQQAQAEKALVDEAAARGVPVKLDKAYTRIAEKMGFTEFSEYLMSEEEIMAQQQAAEEAAMKEQSALEATAQADHGRKMELLNAQGRNELALREMDNMAQPVVQ